MLALVEMNKICWPLPVENPAYAPDRIARNSMFKESPGSSPQTMVVSSSSGVWGEAPVANDFGAFF